MQLTKELLHDMFYYEGGSLYRKVSLGNAKAGDVFGTLSNGRYLRGKINGKLYLVHRLIYLFHHGVLPDFIDHIDGNKLNNNIDNLRPATKSQNQWNAKVRKDNKTSVKNVSWHNKNQAWNVKISVNNKRYDIGYFKDFELAELVAMEARNKYHGNYASQGVK